MARPKLPSVVVWLGLVSLATDAAGEMIYPLLPLYLSMLGAGPRFVGAVEGAAEATASLLKLVSGRITDRTQTRRPLTLFGYSLASLVRPLAGLATAPWMILAIRVTDRIGKGLRSSPRDALLADATPLEIRGRAYGFHRAMDNAGAVIGPAVATALLLLGLPLRRVFLLSAVPGALAVLILLLRVQEVPRSGLAQRSSAGGADVRSRSLRKYLVVLALFALGNSSDAFLLLRAVELGVHQSLIPLLWMVHNGIKAVLSTSGGALSDRFGRRGVICVGWAIYGLTYLGFAYATESWQVWALFVIYGGYYALVEGSEKALVVDLVGPEARGRAFGLFNAVTGLVALPASLGFGALASRYNARVPFTAAAVLAAAAALSLALWVRPPAPAEHR